MRIEKCLLPFKADSRPHIAEHAVAVRIGAAAHHAAVAEHDHGAPRPAAGETRRQIIEQVRMRGTFSLRTEILDGGDNPPRAARWRRLEPARARRREGQEGQKLFP